MAPGFFKRLHTVQKEHRERLAVAAQEEALALLSKEIQQQQQQHKGSSRESAGTEDSQGVATLTRQLLTDKPRPSRRLSSGLSRRTSLSAVNAANVANNNLNVTGIGSGVGGVGLDGLSGDVTGSGAGARQGRSLKRRDSSRVGSVVGAKRPSLPAVDWPAYSSEPRDGNADKRDGGGWGVGTNEDQDPQTMLTAALGARNISGTGTRPRKMARGNNNTDDQESQWVVYD